MNELRSVFNTRVPLHLLSSSSRRQSLNYLFLISPLSLSLSLSLSSLSLSLYQISCGSSSCEMATEKVTPMILKVDLQCSCCYKKVKKTLCKFPQIRDQVYDEKNNQVAIKVVCCSPEKIRDKLCYKGGKAIKSIIILDHPEKPKVAEKPKEAEKPKAAEKPKEAEKPKAAAPAAGKPKESEKPKETPKGPPEKPKDKPAEHEKPKGGPEKPKGDGGAPPPAAKPKDAPKPEQPKMHEPPAAMPPAAMQVMRPGPAPVHGVPSIFPYCGPSHDPYAGGPYYHGYGFPPPQPLYEGPYGHGYGNGYGNAHAHGHVVRNENYFSDENPQTCTIM